MRWQIVFPHPTMFLFVIACWCTSVSTQASVCLLWFSVRGCCSSFGFFILITELRLLEDLHGVLSKFTIIYDPGNYLGRKFPNKIYPYVW